MKTVRRRNMVNREMKLAIGEELQALFHPIVSATKQAAEKTAEELVPVKKALEDIDGALKAQQQPYQPSLVISDRMLKFKSDGSKMGALF